MKQVVGKISIVFICSVAAVVALHYFSIWNRGYIGGGFKRNFIDAPLVGSKSLDLTFNSFYIAGLTRDHIYLGNSTAPFMMKVLDWDLKNTRLEKITLSPPKELPGGFVKLWVDQGSYHLMNGQGPWIYKGSLQDTVATMVPDGGLYFKDIIPMGTGSFILKSESARTHRDILIKKSSLESTVDTTILERQIDGVFCTDGMLQYSQTLSSFVYIYFYRNQYILADSNLQHVKRFRTIDTTSRARLKISKVTSDGTTTLAAPPLIVNKKSFVAGDWLYIQSGVLDDTESIRDLTDYGIMDVYRLSTHRYQFSFYLPLERGHPVTSFQVMDNRIVVLYGQYLVVYEIRESAFEDKQLEADSSLILNLQTPPDLVVNKNRFHK